MSNRLNTILSHVQSDIIHHGYGWFSSTIGIKYVCVNTSGKTIFVSLITPDENYTNHITNTDIKDYICVGQIKSFI